MHQRRLTLVICLTGSILVTAALIWGSTGAHALDSDEVGVQEQEVEEPATVDVPDASAEEIARQARILQVVQAMEALGKTTWPHDIRELLKIWKEDYTVEDWATFITDAADTHGIDPIILTAVTWQEGKFKVRIFGDKKAGQYRACGPTQVRVDIRGRPTC